MHSHLDLALSEEAAFSVDKHWLDKHCKDNER